MKKLSILFMLALAVASCTKEGSDSENGGLFSSEGGFVKLSINLPVTNTTSSKGPNDVYDDGTPNEYAVTDATLIIFEGTGESSAIITEAYDLNLNFIAEDVTKNITTTAKIVQKLDHPLATGNKFYALVILNKNGIFAVNPTTHKLSFNTSTDCTGMTLADFIANTEISLSSNTIFNGSGSAASQFFMSNAPLFTKPGGSSNPAAGEMTILPAIDQSKIFRTAELAATHPATEVYVERAASKVTLSAADGTTTASSLPYKIEGWQLDNTNTATYLIRNVDNFGDWKSLASNGVTTNKYRFVGNNNVATDLYRTYWGEDPNYTDDGGTFVTYWDENTTGISWLSATDGIAYCAENTFDVERQKDINTTTAIVKVKFNGGNTFYTVNNHAASASDLYDADGLKTFIKGYFLSNTSIAAKLTEMHKPGQPDLDASDITVTLPASDSKPGIIKIMSISVSKEKLIDEITADVLAENIIIGSTNALDIVNLNNTIRRYVGGIAYYPVHVKHFGDDLTPWTPDGGGETPIPSASNIYPSDNRNGNYLGRYGMVRNNWYDITVTAIKNLGVATVPTLGRPIVPPVDPQDPEDDPDGPGNGNYDDDIDEYISVKINILAWAKRTQSVEL